MLKGMNPRTLSVRLNSNKTFDKKNWRDNVEDTVGTEADLPSQTVKSRK